MRLCRHIHDWVCVGNPKEDGLDYQREMKEQTIHIEVDVKSGRRWRAERCKKRVTFALMNPARCFILKSVQLWEGMGE